MSKKSSSKTNFLAQGTILVIASFVAKAIGMIYRIPLTHILGDDGNGYYSTANEIYTIILMISQHYTIDVERFINAYVMKPNRNSPSLRSRY